jgi:hypothetical protein
LTEAVFQVVSEKLFATTFFQMQYQTHLQFADIVNSREIIGPPTIPSSPLLLAEPRRESSKKEMFGLRGGVDRGYRAQVK